MRILIIKKKKKKNRNFQFFLPNGSPKFPKGKSSLSERWILIISKLIVERMERDIRHVIHLESREKERRRRKKKEKAPCSKQEFILPKILMTTHPNAIQK